MHQNQPQAWTVRQLIFKMIIWHLSGKTDRGFQNAVIAPGQVFGWWIRVCIILQVQEIHGVLYDLGKYEFVAYGYDRNTARANATQLFLTAFFQYLNWVKFDATDRQVVFYPEATRSIRLPEYFDCLVHFGLPYGRCFLK